MSEYYIMSLKWTRHNEDSITWWCANNSGYTWLLANAGRYTEDQVRGNPGYYDNRVSGVVLREASRTILTEVLGKPASIVGSTLDDKDHEGRVECSGCERGYGYPGPALIVVDGVAS